MSDAASLYPNSKHSDSASSSSVAGPIGDMFGAGDKTPASFSEDRPARHQEGTPQEVRDLRAQSDGLMATFEESAAKSLANDVFMPLYEQGVTMPDGTAMTRGQLQAHAIEMARITQDLGMSKADVQDLVAASREPVDEQTFARLTVEAEKKLRDRYGPDADRALEDAKQLVRRDPRVKAMLDQNGLGSNPAVVLKFAELATRQRLKGRL